MYPPAGDRGNLLRLELPRQGDVGRRLAARGQGVVSRRFASRRLVLRPRGFLDT